MIIYYQVVLVTFYSFIEVRVDDYGHERGHHGHGRDHDYNHAHGHVLHFIYSFFHLFT